jgi:hypothetical protein
VFAQSQAPVVGLAVGLTQEFGQLDDRASEVCENLAIHEIQSDLSD